MRTTPPRPHLAPNGALSVSVPSALPRPWSAPIPVPAPRYRGLKGFFVGLAMGVVCTGLTAVGLPAGGFTSKASLPVSVSPAAAQLASVGDPPCGFDVYRGELWVTSLSARGRVRVWLGDRLVRDGVHLKPGWSVAFPLKHRHSNLDFTVSIVRGPLTSGEGTVRNVSRCEPA